MPKNWPVKSDHNSKWVIGAGAEARGVWFWLENVPKETLFTGSVPKLQKNFVQGEDEHSTLYAQRVKGIIKYLKKTL